jgi:hypothetical protein
LTSFYNTIKFVGNNVGYLVFGKFFSLAAIAALVYFQPFYFENYARTSISSALFASALIIGFPYAIQIRSQDLKKFDPFIIFHICSFFTILAFVTFYILDYDLLGFLAVIVIGISPVIMGHASEVFSLTKSNTIHFLLVALSQPLIYILAIFVPDIDIRNLEDIFFFCTFIGPIYLIYLIHKFLNYRKIFFLQSLTIIVGSGLVSYILADSILKDQELEAGFLWILIQFASILIFLANSLSFRMIKYFSSDNRKSVFNLGSMIYKYLSLLYLLLFILVITNEYHAHYIYCIYLVTQGVSKVAGSAVMSLRVPSLQLYSAIGSFIFLAIFLLLFEQDRLFSIGVLAVLSASFGGAASMLVLLKRRLLMER